MNSTKDCKILYNTLIQKMWKKKKEDEIEIRPFYQIRDSIEYTLKQSKIKKFMDLKDNKFCFLESANVIEVDTQTALITGLFKSARNEFRPDLINKKTGGERRNPKEITEGDIEKTHFVIKIDKNQQDVFLFLEYNFNGVHATTIENYFSSAFKQFLASKSLKQNSSIKHSVIPRENFLDELRSINRTRLAEVYFNKRLLGSQALNFSNRHVSLKREIRLVASASPGESITEVAIDFYNSFTSRQDDISKVRIYGNDEDKNEIVLDTSFMSKVEFVTVDINQDTGEVNSTQLFTELKKIASNF